MCSRVLRLVKGSQPKATKRTVGSQIRILGGVAGAPREGGCGTARLSEEPDNAPEDVQDSADAPSPQRARPATHSHPGQRTLIYEEPTKAATATRHRDPHRHLKCGGSG